MDFIRFGSLGKAVEQHGAVGVAQNLNYIAAVGLLPGLKRLVVELGVKGAFYDKRVASLELALDDVIHDMVGSDTNFFRPLTVTPADVVEYYFLEGIFRDKWQVKLRSKFLAEYGLAGARQADNEY